VVRFQISYFPLVGNKYEKALLDEINNYRLMHGSAQLRINADLDKKAKLWAQKMALEDRESLDVNSQYGQLTFSGITFTSVAVMA
jgi:uncharacterized protein YkwD